jgi:hypothetical protein
MAAGPSSFFLDKKGTKKSRPNAIFSCSFVAQANATGAMKTEIRTVWSGVPLSKNIHWRAHAARAWFHSTSEEIAAPTLLARKDVIKLLQQ